MRTFVPSPTHSKHMLCVHFGTKLPLSLFSPGPETMKILSSARVDRKYDARWSCWEYEKVSKLPDPFHFPFLRAEKMKKSTLETNAQVEKVRVRAWARRGEFTKEESCRFDQAPFSQCSLLR